MATSPLEVPLARLFAIAFRSMLERVHEELAAHGYSDVGSNFGYVLLAARDGALTGADVAQLMGMTKQAASKLIDQMESAMYLERREHPEDGRAKLLFITPRGRRLLATVESIYASLESEWAQVVGKKRLAELRATLVEALHGTHGGELPSVRPLAEQKA